MSVIDDALRWYPINPNLSSEEVLAELLMRLHRVLTSGVPGDVVEMGCHTGTTSIFFQRMIDEYGGGRTLHLYDSFDGLPDPSEHDNPAYGFRGHVTTQIEAVHRTFTDVSLRIPSIHAGWFSEIPDSEFPKKVCFAFFDGDFYTSILDSFKRIYPRLSPGAIVCIHDYNIDAWPGTKKACDDFLADKEEEAVQVCGLLGEVVKL